MQSLTLWVDSTTFPMDLPMPFCCRWYFGNMAPALTKAPQTCHCSRTCRQNTPDHEAAELFIRAIEEMKERFGIVNIVKEIQETDILKLAHYADKEANPLYPVPKLMDASELEKFYYMLMSLTSKENTSEAEK